MPHTTTGKKRNKRPDSRPNAKERKKDCLASAKATPVENLIKTRIHSSKRKERPVTGEFKTQRLDPNTVRIRALQKVLRQIASLAEKHQAGKILNDAQMQKIGRFDAVVGELEELLGSDTEDDEVEETEEEIHEEEILLKAKVKKTQDKSKKSKRNNL